MPDRPANILKFRCDPALAGRLPQPVAARNALPTWLRSMPGEAFSALTAGADDTVKRCPPFIDAMNSGFLLPLVCDVHIRAGEFTWDLDLPMGEGERLRSPLSVHDPGQVTGSPLHQDDEFVIKFHNFWSIQAPPGYSLMFTHPLNRFDLPFTTLTGIVDCDLYGFAPVHFPARWDRPEMEGVLPRGTPIAQCIPIRREPWQIEIGTISPEEQRQALTFQAAARRERGLYRRRFLAPR